MKKKLKVDLDELAALMQDTMDMNTAFLNLENGEIVIIPETLLDGDCLDEENVSDLLEWEQELVEQARDVEENFEKYEEIPTIPTFEVYNLMVEFAHSVTDPELKNMLAVALDGKGAFGRFKKILDSYPEERNRWFELKDETVKEYVKEWLEDIDVEVNWE